MSLNPADDPPRFYHPHAVPNDDRRTPPQAEVLALMRRMEREVEACERARLEQPQIIKDAVREGVAQALAGLGLNDEKAAGDVRDLRQLMADWRSVRLSMVQVIGKAVGLAVLAAFAGYMASQKWGG
jgi:hypothetical protein